MFQGLLRWFRREGVSPQPAARTNDEQLGLTLFRSDGRIRGRLPLPSGRLSDFVARETSVRLLDAQLTLLADGRESDLGEVVVPRDAMVAIELDGNRGNREQRRRMVAHRVEIEAGPYRISGFAHVLPGADPLGFIQRRGAILALTDVVMAYERAGVAVEEQLAGVIVNLAFAASLHDVDAHHLGAMEQEPVEPAERPADIEASP